MLVTGHSLGGALATLFAPEVARGVDASRGFKERADEPWFSSLVELVAGKASAVPREGVPESVRQRPTASLPRQAAELTGDVPVRLRRVRLYTFGAPRESSAPSPRHISPYLPISPRASSAPSPRRVRHARPRRVPQARRGWATPPSPPTSTCSSPACLAHPVRLREPSWANRPLRRWAWSASGSSTAPTSWRACRATPTLPAPCSTTSTWAGGRPRAAPAQVARSYQGGAGATGSADDLNLLPRRVSLPTNTDDRAP